MMTNKTTLEILRDARAWLTDPNHWTAGLLWSPDGERNCALGAIERATGATTWDPVGYRLFPAAVSRLAHAAVDLGGLRHVDAAEVDANTVANFNNKQGHQRTLQMFDLAIEREAAKSATVQTEVEELELVPA